MASKKRAKPAKKKKVVRRSKEFLRRSKASKLGWQRRRERDEKIEAVDAAIVKAGHLATQDARIAELERINKDAMDLIEFMKRSAVKHPDPDVMKKFRRNGTLAFQPSILRHYEETNDWLERLEEANKIGRLHEEVALIARESHSSAQEVYTLFHSP